MDAPTTALGAAAQLGASLSLWRRQYRSEVRSQTSGKAAQLSYFFYGPNGPEEKLVTRDTAAAVRRKTAPAKEGDFTGEESNPEWYQTDEVSDDKRLEMLMRRQRGFLTRAVFEMQQFGKKTKHWAWWAFPHDREGRSEPAGQSKIRTRVTPHNAEKLVEKAPAEWIELLQLIGSIVEGRGSIQGVIPEEDWPRIRRFCEFWGNVTFQLPDWLQVAVARLRTAMGGQREEVLVAALAGVGGEKDPEMKGQRKKVAINMMVAALARAEGEKDPEKSGHQMVGALSTLEEDAATLEQDRRRMRALWEVMRANHREERPVTTSEEKGHERLTPRGSCRVGAVRPARVSKARRLKDAEASVIRLAAEVRELHRRVKEGERRVGHAVRRSEALSRRSRWNKKHQTIKTEQAEAVHKLVAMLDRRANRKEQQRRFHSTVVKIRMHDGDAGTVEALADTGAFAGFISSSKVRGVPEARNPSREAGKAKSA